MAMAYFFIREVSVMVDYFVAQAVPVGAACVGNVGAKGMGIEALSVSAPESPSLVEQLKTLLKTASVQQLKTFLRKTYEEVRDLNQFNLILLSANVISDEQLSVSMDVILKSLNDEPVIRLADTRGDFCVIRFDRKS